MAVSTTFLINSYSYICIDHKDIDTHVIVKIVKKNVSTFIISFIHNNICIDRGGSRRGSLGEAHTLVGGGGTVILGLFLVFVKPIFLEV